MTAPSPHEQAMASLRRKCVELYNQMQRDAMLRQGDPVETLFTFAKSMIDDREYVIGWNHGWEEYEYQAANGEPKP